MNKIITFIKKIPPYTGKACIIALVTQAIMYWLPMILNIQGAHVLSSAIDDALPVIPLFVIPYFGAYLLWAGGYLYVTWFDKEFAKRFLTADLLARAFCAVCFIVYPCTLAQPEPSGFGAWMLKFLYMIDEPINLLPSTHCYLTHLIVRPFLAGYFPQVKKPVRIGLYVFAVLIYLSTLFTKQHVLLDVITGIAIAEIMWWVSAFIYRKKK